MRGGCGTSSFLASSLAMTATACSLLVTTGGLSGGADTDAGGSLQGSTGSSPSEPGTAPGDAAAAQGFPPTAEGGSGNADTSSGSAPEGTPEAGASGSNLDAGTQGPSPGNDAGAQDPNPTADAATDAPAAAPPQPPTACSVGRARVFLTSTLYDGDFGGVNGADADCTARASAGGLGGQWRAWLSDTDTPALSHVYAAPNGYVLLDGTVVASSFVALISGSLAHAIDLTELSAPSPDGYTEVWTGIDLTGGMASDGYCSDDSGDWSSSNSGALTPLVGHSNAADSTWTAAYLQFCNRTDVRLYCFETCN